MKKIKDTYLRLPSYTTSNKAVKQECDVPSGTNDDKQSSDNIQSKFGTFGNSTENLTPRTVLVTGGSGFLGQHIMKHLQERATHVDAIRVLDVKPYRKRISE